MSPNEAKKIISAAGGVTGFAKLLGLADTPWHKQRISNWLRRGIPPSVLIEHYNVIQRLRGDDAKKRA